MKHTPDIRRPFALPDVALHCLASWTGRYSSVESVFYAVWLDTDYYCGVFGDGDNGAYEWFVFKGGQLETSDVGYGDTTIALRDVLLKVAPLSTLSLAQGEKGK